MSDQVQADWATWRQAGSDRQGSYSGRLFKLSDALSAIADADGDVDAFAAAQALKGACARDDLAIARRLFEAGLSKDALRGYLKRLPDFEDVEVEARALAHVEAPPNALAALSFPLGWPDLRGAARLVRARLGELDGEVYERLTPAAEALALKDPLAATLLYRQMIDDALQFGRSGRYRHAVRHLQHCASLALAVVDWETHPPHSTYLEGLSQRHRYKDGFWARLAGA